MPIVSALGAMSSRGFGEFAQSSATGKYIEDYFSTWLYTGNGSSQTINNGIALADTAAWTFNQLIGTAYFYPEKIKIDGSGNIYTVGITNNGSSAAATIVKTNSTGAVSWKKVFGPSLSYSWFYGLALDSGGYVYAVGILDNQWLICKYDLNGNEVWQRTYSGGGGQARGVAVDSAGNFIVVGDMSDGVRSCFTTMKCDSSGAIIWQRKMFESRGYGYGVAVNSSNEIFVVGSMDTAGGGQTSFFAKYSSSGTLDTGSIRRYAESGQSSQFIPSVCLDSSGNIYLPVNATVLGVTSPHLIKLDNTLGQVWKVQITLSSTGLTLYDISIDSSNNLYLSGQSSGGATGGAVFKYTSSGSLSWQRFFSSALGTVQLRASAVDSTNVYIGGYASSTGGYITVPSNGAATGGTAGAINMALGGFTSSTSTIPTNSVGYTEAAASLTGASSSISYSATTVTSSLFTQAAVTGAGGLVWIKNRNLTEDNNIFDTARGISKYIISNSTGAQFTNTGYGVTSFNASGFTVTDLVGGNAGVNGVQFSQIYASWTWRKTPKFFDVVTYTGNGAASQTISHNLGSVPGMIIVKKTSGAGEDWFVYHRGLNGGVNPQNFYLNLNRNYAQSNYGSDLWSPTATTFSSVYNTSGQTYVVYLFAHNAGGFGLDGTQNVISCGSYTGNGSADGPTITLGWEPQWVMIKRTDSTGSWWMMDVMRGMSRTDSLDLQANASTQELTDGASYARPLATGFSPGINYAGVNASGGTYIYIAIRRGPMKVPTDATTVFSPAIYTGDYNTTTPVTNMLPATDVWWNAARTIASSYFVMDRLRGWRWFNTPSTAAETSSPTWSQPTQTTLLPNAAWWGSSQSNVNYFFRRAPGFMDEVCYVGTGANASFSHNLGVVPELMIVKRRDTTGNWRVYSSTTGNTRSMVLNAVDTANVSPTVWNNTSPTSSVFSVGTLSDVNAALGDYVAYLFASCPGVSKVGGYTGNGATQTISCGFNGGARYVLIKRTDVSGSWWVWDTARGMVAGTDPRIPTNSAVAETNANWVYTTTGGFQIVTSDATVNANGGSYIYLAIA